MVKKSVKVTVEESECYSSAAKVFFDSRLIIWSIVEAVRLSLEEPQPQIEVELENWPAELPVAFGAMGENEISSHKKKKKQKKRKFSSSEKSSDDSLWSYYCKNMKTSHRIQEENYFYVPSSLWTLTEDNTSGEDDSVAPQYHLVEVRGVHSVASKELPEDVLVIRFLHSQQYSLIYRSQLIPLQTVSQRVAISNTLYEINTTYQIIDEDFWYRLRLSKPPTIHDKYWDQRYRIFHKFDKGILLDEESWYSVTYECIGDYIVSRCQDIAKKHSLGQIQRVIDGFSGCGGIAIPLAKQGLFTVAVDIDERKLQYLNHNARIYQVETRIDLVQDNIWMYLKSIANMTSFERYLTILERHDERQAQTSNDGRTYQPPLLSELFKYKPYIVVTEENEVEEEAPLDNTAPIERSPAHKKQKHVRFEDQPDRDVAVNKTSPSLATVETERDLSPIPEVAKTNPTCLPLDSVEREDQKTTNISPSHQSRLSSQSYQLKQQLFDLVILSPPWNGPGYLLHEDYDLRTMLCCGDGYYLACLTAAVTHFFVLVLPRNTPNAAISQLCNIIHYQVIIENIYLHQKCKVKVCYFFYRHPNNQKM